MRQFKCPHGRLLKQESKLGIVVYKHDDDDSVCKLLNTANLSSSKLNEAYLEANPAVNSKFVLACIEDKGVQNYIVEKIVTEPDINNVAATLKGLHEKGRLGDGLIAELIARIGTVAAEELFKQVYLLDFPTPNVARKSGITGAYKYQDIIHGSHTEFAKQKAVCLPDMRYTKNLLIEQEGSQAWFDWGVLSFLGADYEVKGLIKQCIEEYLITYSDKEIVDELEKVINEMIDKQVDVSKMAEMLNQALINKKTEEVTAP